MSEQIERFNSGRVAARHRAFPRRRRVGGMLYLSGQLGNVPGQLSSSMAACAPRRGRRCENIRTVLRGQGLDLEHLVRCTVMLADMADWPAFNEVYREFFGDMPTARAQRAGLQRPGAGRARRDRVHGGALSD